MPKKRIRLKEKNKLLLYDLIAEAKEFDLRVLSIHEMKELGTWQVYLHNDTTKETPFSRDEDPLIAFRKALDLYQKWIRAEKAQKGKRIESEQPAKRKRIRLRK